MKAPPQCPPEGLTLIDHHAARPVLMRDVHRPEATLLRGIQTLQKCQLETFLNMGTALGFRREGDFIPNDTDIDVGVLGDWENFASTLRTKDRLTMALRFEPLRTILYAGRPMQHAFIDPENSCIFDIYYFYLNYEPHTVVNVNAYGFMRYPREMFEQPVKSFKSKYGKLPVLAKWEEYLAWQYGDTWKEPREGDKGLYWRGLPA
jgi:hypothetical protein